MNAILTNLWRRLYKRLAPFGDLTVWTLLLISVGPLLIFDTPMALTLVQWGAFGFALAGVTVLISRLVFPTLDLSVFVAKAREGDPAAGLVVLAVALFLGLAMMGMVLWAKG